MKILFDSIKSFYPTLFVLIFFVSCQQRHDSKATVDAFQTLDTTEVSNLLDLNSQVALNFYPDLLYQEQSGAIIIYSKKNPLVLDPNLYIEDHFEHRDYDSIYNKPSLILSQKYKDTTKFHFSSDYSSTDSTALYFENTVVQISNYDLTKEFIPDLNSAEEWSVMANHELFHDYQRSFTEFERIGRELSEIYNMDQILSEMYEDPIYAMLVEQENEILIRLWTDDSADLSTELIRFKNLRDQRKNYTQTKYNIPIFALEDYQVTSEGHARFFESLVKKQLATSVQQNNPYKDYLVSKDLALMRISNNKYWYPLGFNTAMVLEKYLPNYRMYLYKDGKNLNECMDDLFEIVMRFDNSLVISSI